VRFELTLPTTVRFGAGTLQELGAHAAALGRRAWLVTGAGALDRSGVIARVEADLAAHGLACTRQRVAGEPTTDVVDVGAHGARSARAEVVIGIGGGSVLDAAKAVACLAANDGEALDYLEVVGRGRTLEHAPLPFVAVPTTAGTGSEATRNAVLLDPSSRTKASLRHPSLLPRVALLDPGLTLGLPPDVTARAGLDALIQLVEPYVSRRPHPLVDPWALDALRRGARALPRAYADGGDAGARAAMMLAAFVSGVALAHRGLGVSHAFSGPLGGAYPVPHGIACAATWAPGMAANLRAARTSAERDPAAQETVARYAAVARALGAAEGADEAATAWAGVEWARALCARLGVPPLRTFGVNADAVPDLVARARRTSSMQANPMDLTDEALAGVMLEAIG
jgi:alcohol dehydrogenase class IV